MPVTSGTVAVRLAVKAPLIVFLNPPPVRLICWPSIPALPAPAANPVAVGDGGADGKYPLPLSRKLNPVTWKPPPVVGQVKAPPVLRQTVADACPGTGVQVTSTPCDPFTVMGLDFGLIRDTPPNTSFAMMP